MTDTPTHAPALTDEQIDENIANLRAAWSVYSTGDTDDAEALEAVNYVLAAVIARAKREERERIAAALKTSAIALGDRDSLNNSQRALRNGLMIGAQLALQEPTR